MLSTKGVASLLSNKIWRVITFPITYLLVAVLAFTAIMQIKYVNRALYRFDATQVIPIQFVLFTLSVIIGSAILYRDFERKTSEDALKFFAGCALTFAGVWCITSGRARAGEEDEEGEESEEEDNIRLVDEERQLPEIREDREGEEQQEEEEEQEQQTTPLRPQTPRLQTSRSDTPVLKFTHAEDEDEETGTPFGDPSPFTENPWQTPSTPATAAAIHTDTAELPETPTPKRRDRQPQKPPIHATTSEPSIPTTAHPRQHSTAPNTPLQGPSRDRHQRPSTPDNIHTLDPASSSVPRFGSAHRSISSMIIAAPGPLTNPLSSSLSAVIADSLRRGVDVGPGGGSAASGRRRGGALRGKRSRRLDQAGSRRGSTVDDGVEDGLRRSQSQRSASLQPSSLFGAEGGERPVRGRSLSSTIGDMFRSRRLRSGDEEQGDIESRGG